MLLEKLILQRKGRARLCPAPKTNVTFGLGVHAGGDVFFHGGCGDGKINCLYWGNLPLIWYYRAACSIEVLCSCLWTALSHSLGRELNVRRLWAVVSAGTSVSVRSRGWAALEGVAGHLFCNTLVIAGPASKSNQVACVNCKVISAFG